MRVSICVCVYNEERIIGKLLESLINQKTNKINIIEIIVVSSACTDRTNEIVKEYMKEDRRIRLIEQEKREGKAAAINLFLKEARGDVFVLESGDTVPELDCIENLCLPFFDERIGMTGAASIPVNKKDNFTGYIVNTWWFISNNLPRFGELVAFRSFVKEIDKKTAVDEAYIENLIVKRGYKLKLVKNAIVRNRGASNLKDLLKQRRRIYVGHTLLKKVNKYKVGSFDFYRILKLSFIFWKKDPKFRNLLWLISGMGIEIYGRLLGMYDLYILKKNPYAWDIAKSTKDAI